MYDSELPKSMQFLSQTKNIHLLQSGKCIFAITEHAVISKSICISHTGGLNCRPKTMELLGFF